MIGNALQFIRTCTLLGVAAVLALPLCSQTSSSTSTPEDTYQLQAGDKIYFRIEEDPTPVKAAEEVLVVNALHSLQIPVSRGSDVVVTLNVKGKTLAQVQNELKSKLDEDYYVDAHVRLNLKDQTQRLGKVLFTGAVKANVLQLVPGQSVTIYEAIAQMGTTEFANLKKVILNRLDPVTHKPKVITVDIDAIKKDRTKDLPLQDGDRVEVKEKPFLF